MTYPDFLRSKIVAAPVSGFAVRPEKINPALKPHQRDAVMWACRGGRRALFESFGLGKTVQELEYCRLVIDHGEVGKALIVLPLGVRQEFTHDAAAILGMPAPRCITATEQADEVGIYLTNYERVRDGGVDPQAFGAAVLDEAAVLRSFGSKTYQTFLPLFRGVKYKLVATATPAPNRLKELIHYAGFLEIMDTGQALTRFFQRDSTKANNLTLYPHKEEEFWLWVSTWALFIGAPSDLGYDDAGYALPPMEVRKHIVSESYDAVEDRDGQMKLQNDVAEGLAEASREKSGSIAARVAKARELVDAAPGEHFVLWHDLEAERREILRQIPGVVDIYGAMDYDERERRVIDFSEGRTRLFATKKSLSGCGCNFQRHCHRAIFVGIDYQFHDFIQAVHRIYRFLQSEQVVIDIIITEAEQPVYDALMQKWALHNEMQQRMGDIVRRYGLHHRDAIESMARSIGVQRVEIKGKHFTAVNNDCVEETAHMPDSSVDLIVTSVPFSNHYEYTPSYNDFGHNEDNQRFFEQMDYLTPNLLRVLKPGRLACVHVKDRILFGNATGTGMPTVDPFSDMCVMHYMRHGFQYMGRICILTDVVRENNQTYRLGWSEQCKPLCTVDASNRYGLITPYLDKYYGNGCGAELLEPMPTVTGKDHMSFAVPYMEMYHNGGYHGRGNTPLDPVNTITASGSMSVNVAHIARAEPGIDLHHWPQVRALLNKYCGYHLEDDEIFLLWVRGAWHFIADIGLRMLTPRELYAANGFPPDYIIDRDYQGNAYPRYEQVARCGNAVPPPFATALVRANLPEWCSTTIASMDQLLHRMAI